MDSLGGDGPPDTVPGTPDLSLSFEEIAEGEPLGKGGNADVFRVDVERGGRTIPVAVKQPRLQRTLETGTVDRFVREADIWAELDDHNHVVGLFDWGTEPLPWLAMEYMDAGSLADVPDGTRLPLEQALWAGMCVCEAVHHAHRHGVAHHDIKPANVLVATAPRGWAVPKVSDWGLARMMLEETGSIEGLSPQYAAPEQFDAQQYGSPDDRTDIYQTGTLIYELVTGQPPFQGGAASVMQDVLSTRPDRPSERADLPESIDDALTPALRKEPSERYESVLYLRDAIRDVFEQRRTRSSRTETTSGTPEGDSRGRDRARLGGGSRPPSPTESGRDRPAAHQRTGGGSKSGGGHDRDEPDTPNRTDDDSVLSRRMMIAGATGVGAVGAGGLGLYTIRSQTGGDDGNGDDGNGGDATPEEAVDTYLTENDANGYDGMDSIMDMTGQDEVNITVGPNGNFQMEPAAARISEGTTVGWTWDSAGHSVTYREGPTDDEFNVGGPSASAGRTLEHTFDNGTGEVLYRCNPHAAQGHYAALIVE